MRPCEYLLSTMLNLLNCIPTDDFVFEFIMLMTKIGIFSYHYRRPNENSHAAHISSNDVCSLLSRNELAHT